MLRFFFLMRVTVLRSEGVDFRAKKITRDAEGLRSECNM